jgi:hypothetical protein
MADLCHCYRDGQILRLHVICEGDNNGKTYNASTKKLGKEHAYQF